MRTLMFRLWRDDRGTGLLTGEFLFLFTILVLGVITGLVAVRQAMISELTETAQSMMALNQSFSFSGQSNCQSSTAGSSASDITNTIHEFSVGASTALIDQSPCDHANFAPGTAGIASGHVHDRPAASGSPPVGRETGTAGSRPGNANDRTAASGVPRTNREAGNVSGNGNDRTPVSGGPRADGGAGTGGSTSGNGNDGTTASGGPQQQMPGGGDTAPKSPAGDGGGRGQSPEKQTTPTPSTKSAILIGVDGTGAWLNKTYEREMADSFVHRIDRDSPITHKRYHRGPDTAGYSSISPSDLRDEVKELLDKAGSQGPVPIFMTGYSRGGAIVITAAKLLKKDGIDVEAMFLFDTVQRDVAPPLTLDSAVIPSNVKKCYHAVRDRRAGSRGSFGNSGLEREGRKKFDGFDYFFTTHAGMGGTPWGQKGEKDGYINEGFPDYKTNVTVAEEAAGSKEVEEWMWKFLRQNGVLR
jgi:hypothetical protein